MSILSCLTLVQQTDRGLALRAELKGPWLLVRVVLDWREVAVLLIGCEHEKVRRKRRKHHIAQ